MKRLILLTAAFLLAGSVRAADDNWPQWRGPQANGFAPTGDPPLKWDGKTNVAWKAAIPGKGASTPIVWGDQVFILTAIDTKKQADAKDIPKPDPGFSTKTDAPRNYYQFVVMSFDKKTGKVRWQQTAAEQVPHEGHHPTHTYAAFSPTTDGKHVYAFFGSRGVYCYDMAGKLIWKRDLGRMHTRHGWGEAASPCLYGDALIVPWDQEKGSYITCLDAATGQTRWKTDRDEPSSWATPVVVPFQGKTQVIVNGTKRVRSYDLATGKVIWECGGQTLNAIPCPIVNDGMAICMSGYKGALACAVALDARGDVTGTNKVIWKHARGTPYVPSPILAGGKLWFTQRNDNVHTCLDARTGKVIFEKERLPRLTSLYASPVGAKDRIYFTGRDGTIVVIKQAGKVEVLATNKLGEPVDASPAIVGKQLFLRGDKHLYCIE